MLRIASRLILWLVPLVAVWAVVGRAYAQDAEAVAANPGDVAWILTSSAIVLMMTIPGLALFYGGLVRAKNVLSILMQCLIAAGLMSLLWVVAGYSLAFSGEGSFIGNLDKAMLDGITPDTLWGYSIAFGPDVAGGFLGDPWALFALRGVPADAGPGDTGQLNMIFQLMFAAITPALIVGAFAERMKFSAFFLFTLAWSTLIYAPLCHWVWGPDGWLGALGALDFAGGTVVHISSGTAALVAALMIGRRRGYGARPMPPHNVPYTVVGAALLWVGWFGFNSGSALAADGTAVLAFVNTNTATGAAVLGWLLAEWLGRGKPTVLGAATGAVAGLVAITPACGFVDMPGSLVIGLGAGLLCYKACSLKNKLGYDDALDVVGVHGVGGTWGALMTGVLAVESGAVYGFGWGQFGEQVIAVLATYAFVGVGSFAILGIVNLAVGLRVDPESEEGGLDLAEHSESAYSTQPGTPVAE